MFETPVLVAIIGGIFLTISGLVAWVSTRGKTKTDAKTALDARIDARVEKQLSEAWEQIDSQKKRIDELETTTKIQETQITALKEHDTRRAGAFGRILRAIAAQWPTPDGPNLDPVDIQMVEDTIPPAWIRRRLEAGGIELAQPP